MDERDGSFRSTRDWHSVRRDDDTAHRIVDHSDTTIAAFTTNSTYIYPGEHKGQKYKKNTKNTTRGRDERRCRDRRTRNEGDDHHDDTSPRCTLSRKILPDNHCARLEKTRFHHVAGLHRGHTPVQPPHIEQKLRLARTCRSQAMACRATSSHPPCSKTPYFPTTFAQC
jgi:hypothetical protein